MSAPAIARTALDTLDWRRRTFALYEEVRALPPEEGHGLWVATRDELFREHPREVVACPRLHPRGDLLAQQFEQEVGGDAHALTPSLSTHLTQAALARSRTRPM